MLIKFIISVHYFVIFSRDNTTMDYFTDKIYFKSKNAFLLTTILLTLAFIAGVGMQGFFPVLSIQLLISIFLVLFTFVFNVTLGMTGFLLSLTLNILQIIVYIYKVTVLQDRNSYYLLAVTSLSIVITLLFQLFMRRVSDNIIKLREKLDNEQSRRISSETTSLIESTMMRQNLITKHETIKDAKAVSESISNSKSSHLDSLTTLPGRERIFAHIDKLVNESIASEKTSSVRIIYMTALDSEHFLNNLGHRATDLFIQCIAHRIRECAHPDDLVGRISRLEFVIVTDREMSDSVFNSYIDALIMAAEDSVMNEAGNARLKYYAGYSVFPETSRFSGDLLYEAERAVREAIRTNSGTVHFEAPESVIRVYNSPLYNLSKQELIDTMENAIKGDEINMVYQPQFNRDGKLTGVEAFVRWNSPIYGQVSPSNFLIIAERANAMYEIGIICIRKALTMLSEINKINPELKMAINLSSAQLESPDIVNDFSELVSAFNINKKNIVIDIPEESLLTDINASRPVIEAFAELDITMALDNFGRCYSSLNNIPLFPISLVKLDSHFTSDLREGSHYRILSSSIIDLLTEIDIPVTATGVASEESYNALKSFGCQYFQGLYFSNPMTDEAIVDYVKSH